MSVSHTPEEHQIRSIGQRAVRIFPSSDSAFRAAVVAAFGALVSWDGRVTDQLEAALRREYPGVRAVEQTDLGAGFDEPCIYVFRDGSASPQLGDGPGTPRYLGPLVMPQRTAVRNLVARERSIALVATSVLAVRRSRERRAIDAVER